MAISCIVGKFEIRNGSGVEENGPVVAGHAAVSDLRNR